jgi:surfeit locus 1 family protein
MTLLRLLSRKWILTTVLVIAGAAVCARLGIWQLDRLQQRRAFNSHVLAMRAMPPADLSAVAGAEDLLDMEYRAASATGTYDFAHQIGIRNQSYNDQYGLHLVTPLVMKDGDAVLVDRGWIPTEVNSTPADWHKYDAPAGETAIQGIIRQSQSTPGFGGVPDPTLTPGQTKLDLWIYVNIDRIAKQLPYPALPVYVQLNADPNRTDPPIPYQEELDLSEGPHQGYAIQWFSFATILLVGYPFYVRRQLKEQGNPKE